MGQWDKAKDILTAAAQEKGATKAGNVQVALENITVRLWNNVLTLHSQMTINCSLHHGLRAI